jgi:nucleoid-associated protein YgaU
VASACAALALAAWAWLALGVCACWWSARRGGAPAPPAWTPRLARVLVAAAIGVALPALDATAAPSSTSTTDLLRGLQLPDRAVGAVAPLHRAPAHRATRVRVRAGDCLWDLAEARLADAASPQEVERAWRSLYRANRSRIGSDPDLLRPGTDLVLPATLDRSPPAGGHR